MNPIGGYFELETNKGEHYHPNAIRLNTARNCLEYILRAKRYGKIYIPKFLCDVLLEPMKKLGIDFEYYSIDEQLNPTFDKDLRDGEAFLYINYFGLKQTTAKILADKLGQKLIVDNSQAFFEKPIEGIDTFYSARKFFGVADGAYVYTDRKLEEDLEQDKSYERTSHLLKRVDLSAEEAYADFQQNENKLINQPILLMSKLTEKLLTSIDYEKVKTARKQNYKFFDDQLLGKNKLSLPAGEAVPMVYPFRTGDPSLRQKLIDNKVFVATYWPNVVEADDHDSLEYLLAKQIIPLPIDQRYNVGDLARVRSLINE